MHHAFKVGSGGRTLDDGGSTHGLLDFELFDNAFQRGIGLEGRFGLERHSLPDDAARDHRLGLIVVELHGEGEHEGIEVLVQCCEVEAEDVPRGIDVF